MLTDWQKVENWEAQKPVSEWWPGTAVRNWKNEVDFRKGVVLQVTNLSISVETNHPLYPKVTLMGECYTHYCESCKRTIPGYVTYRRSFGTTLNSAGQEVPIRFFCPLCGPDFMLRNLRIGDRLKLHYRFQIVGEEKSGMWFAEVV